MTMRGIAAVLGLGILLAGCGLSAPGGTRSERAGQGIGYGEMKDEAGAPAALEVASAATMNAPAPSGAAIPPAATVRASSPTASRRLVITTGSVAVEVASYPDAASAVTKAADEFGGFVSGSEATVGEAGRRHGTITLRVPAEKWNVLLERVRGLGKVLRESSNGMDVTEEFVDLESRLKAQRQLESELLELMESARRGGLRDLLEIEREIARVRGEIESMEGRRRYLADQAALSTLTVELREPAALVEVEPGALDPVFEALGEAVSLAARSVGAIIVFVAVLLPWIGAAWILFLLVRWWWRRRK